MSLQVFGCPECEQPFQVDSRQVGQQVRCPRCAAVVEIPSARAAAEVASSTVETTATESQESPQAFACPSCQSVFGVLASMYGTTMACPSCRQAVAIERASAANAPVIDVRKSFAPTLEKDNLEIDSDVSSVSNPSSESAEAYEAIGAVEEIPVFEPQSVDHLLPPRFATLDPAFFYRRGIAQDQVLLRHADGSVQAVSNRIVTIVHNGREYQLISSPRYRRAMNIIVNTFLMFVAAALLVAIYFSVA